MMLPITAMEEESSFITYRIKGQFIVLDTDTYSLPLFNKKIVKVPFAVLVGTPEYERIIDNEAADYVIAEVDKLYGNYSIQEQSKEVVDDFSEEAFEREELQRIREGKMQKLRNR